MTTVGYGNVAAVTLGGRITACITAFWGVFVLSLLVGTVESVFNFKDETKL